MLLCLQLILDEPVNFLDLRSVIWLQDYLLTFPSTILLVAHDRDFIDATAEEIIVLRNKTLTYYEGNLTDYERQVSTVPLVSLPTDCCALRLEKSTRQPKG